ncbi:hypothetical protein, partial [Petrachloros mirabilis]
ADLMQSAFWHRFTTTAHSPIGLNPKSHGLHILGPDFKGFAENDLRHRDQVGQTPEWLGEGLRRSMLNFLEGRGLKMDVRHWFDHQAPKPRVPSSWVNRLLRNRHRKDDPGVERRLVWLGEAPCCTVSGKHRRITLRGYTSTAAIIRREAETHWLTDLIKKNSPHSKRSTPYQLFREASATYPGSSKEFATFIASPAWAKIRSAGLLLV